MTNILDETTNAKQAVLFICGGINEIAEQIVTMLRYCWKKHLKIVDIFLDMSGNAKQEKQCYDDLLAFIKYVDTKTAVVFYDNKIFHKYADTNDFLRFTATKKIELHLAKNRIILSNPNK